MKPLSEEMRKALQLVKQHDKLVHYSGGYWQREGDPCEGRFCGHHYPLDYVGTKTILALIRRGVLVVTVQITRGGAALPREVMLTKFGAVCYINLLPQ